MKLYLAAVLLLSAAPAMAQTAAPAAPAPASQAAPAAPAAGGLSADTPIEKLMAEPASKAAVLKTFPKLDENPAYDQFKALSMRQLSQMLGGAIPAEKIAQLDKDLAELK
jgi:3-oxoacyl-ACP reductase-like protein